MSIWNKAYEDFRSHYYGDIEEKKMSKEKHIKAAKAGKRWQDSDGDGKWYEKGEDVKEGVRDKDPEKGTAERKARLEKKRGMKMDDHPQYKKEETEEVTEGSMKQARKNVGASTCWDGYKAKGTKMKGGKSVPNCVKEDEVSEDVETIEEKKKGLYANIHAKRARGESPAKPGDEDYPAKDAFKKAAKTAKKEHYDWRADFDFVIEKKSDDCGCDHTPKKGVKNKVTVMPEVKTEETELQEGPYIITGPDITGNTPAYRNFKAGMKSKVTGKPMYKLGPGVKLPEEVELDENRRAARSAGGYKDDSKKQPDPSKDGFTGIGNMSIDQIRKMSARIDKKNKSKKEEVEFAGNYEGPLYAPHPDIAKEDLAGAVDSITKKAQGALQRVGVKINNKPRPTARPSVPAANTMRQNKMSNEETIEEKKKKDDSYLETNMKKRQSNNEKARKDMEKMGTKMKNPHFEETLLDKVVKGYVSEEDYDRMKDRRMERGGVGGNQRYNSDKGIKKGPMSDADKKKSREASSRAMDAVRASITSKYGKGALIDTKKKKDK